MNEFRLVALDDGSGHVGLVHMLKRELNFAIWVYFAEQKSVHICFGSVGIR
jgi:hypothetical protein